MRKQKISNVLKKMEALGLSGILVRNPENVLYLTGYWPTIGRSLLFMGSEGESRLLAPASEREFVPEDCVDRVEWQQDEGLDSIFDPYPRFKQFLGQLKGKIGVEMGSEVVSTVHVGTEVSYASCRTFDLVREAGGEPVDFSSELERLRQQKDEEDVMKITTSYELAAVGLREGQSRLKEGMSEAELASLIEYAINSSVGYRGTQRVRAYAFVMSGDRGSVAYYPFNTSSEKKIRENESVLIELDVQADGYWSDTTRTWFINPSKELRDRYEAVLEANEAAVRAAKIGARAADVDTVARQVIKERGYESEFFTRLGHGVGYRHHELPALHPASKDIILEGAVFTVEPGVYAKGFGIRIENGVVATPSGGRRLDVAPMDL